MINLKNNLKLKYVIAVLFICTLTLWIFMGMNIPEDITISPKIHHDTKHLQDPDLKINLNELYSIGECLLEEAGKKIVDIRKNSKNKDIVGIKSDKSVITKADIESHKIIMHTLQYKYKVLNIRSEEDGNLELKDVPEAKRILGICDKYVKKKTDAVFHVKDLNVWIDPLDATIEYSEYLTDYVSVMLCVAIKGEPQIGIIHKPFTKSTVKSFLENEPEREIEPPFGNRIIISRSHGEWFPEFIKKQHIFVNMSVTSAGGSGYKAMEILNDKADVYLHVSKIKKWDICAPNAIIKNKGGKFLTRNGQKIRYDTEDPVLNTGFIGALNNFGYYFDSFKEQNKKQ